MKFLRILLILIACSSSLPLWADIATAGEQTVFVELLNGKAFPKYKFYVKYQTYHYDMGYKPGAIEIVYLLPGKPIETGDRGSSSFLYAKGPKGEWASKVEIGGSEIDLHGREDHLLDRIKIIKMNPNGKVIEFQVVERQKIDANGKVLETINKSSMGQPWWFWAMPLVCLLGLVAFFLLRRKPEQA